jgi:hypothetical protein
LSHVPFGYMYEFYLALACFYEARGSFKPVGYEGFSAFRVALEVSCHVSISLIMDRKSTRIVRSFVGSALLNVYTTAAHSADPLFCSPDTEVNMDFRVYCAESGRCP